MPGASEDALGLLRGEIKKYDKPENKLNYQRFFKEKLERPEAIKTAILHKISRQVYIQFRHLPGKEVLSVCDDLLASGERYMRYMAFEWALRVKGQYRVQDFTRFASWLKKYVDNWGACDHLCCGPLGYFVYQFPEILPKTKRWTRSQNRWLRRASAVCLIVPVRKGILLREIFARAEVLLMDEDDLVQKGYGWMLKEAGNVFPDEVFAFVMEHKDRMPRTALRYAIEKFPAARRKQAMRKG